MPHRVQFTTIVSCPGCGNAGEARWEENSEPNPAGLNRVFLGVSPGFGHEPQQQDKSRDPAIHCRNCGSQLAD